mmetsp:Transcript_69955/g.202731  ORF Transcript_69955/g.202731 Transcript_69955/m.202731 type:complete len:328 (+) Transcript_69955:967-1950(+)
MQGHDDSHLCGAADVVQQNHEDAVYTSPRLFDGVEKHAERPLLPVAVGVPGLQGARQGSQVSRQLELGLTDGPRNQQVVVLLQAGARLAPAEASAALRHRIDQDGHRDVGLPEGLEVRAQRRADAGDNLLVLLQDAEHLLDAPRRGLGIERNQQRDVVHVLHMLADVGDAGRQHDLPHHVPHLCHLGLQRDEAVPTRLQAELRAQRARPLVALRAVDLEPDARGLQRLRVARHLHGRWELHPGHPNHDLLVLQRGDGARQGPAIFRMQSLGRHGPGTDLVDFQTAVGPLRRAEDIVPRQLCCHVELRLARQGPVRESHRGQAGGLPL